VRVALLCRRVEAHVQGGVKVALYRQGWAAHPACGVAGRPRRLKGYASTLSLHSL